MAELRNQLNSGFKMENHMKPYKLKTQTTMFTKSIDGGKTVDQTKSMNGSIKDQDLAFTLTNF